MKISLRKVCVLSLNLFHTTAFFQGKTKLIYLFMRNMVFKQKERMVKAQVTNLESPNLQSLQHVNSNQI